MATYYTEAYTNNVSPDSNAPAGALLMNVSKFIGKTDGNAQNDIVRMVRVPINSILYDVRVSWSASADANATVQVGTSAGADSIMNALTTTGIGFASLGAGVQGTTAIATGLKAASSIRPGYKFTSADYITVKFNGSAGWPADAEIEVAYVYSMDYGADLSTDGDNVTDQS